MRNDVELLREYAGTGSEDAFAELVRRHLPLVYSAALRQVGGDHALAKDVAQTVFIDLARKAGSLSGRLLLSGWLYTSTRFAASNAVRQDRRRKVREQAAFEMQNSSPTESRGPALDAALDEAMAQLDMPDRDAVLLRYFERNELRTVGTVLGVSEDAARMRINRALERLRALLEQRGVAISAGALGAALTTEAVKAAPAELAPGISRAALAGTAAGLAMLPSWLAPVVTHKVAVVIVAAAVAGGAALYVVAKRQPEPAVTQSVSTEPGANVTITGTDSSADPPGRIRGVPMPAQRPMARPMPGLPRPPQVPGRLSPRETELPAVSGRGGFLPPRNSRRSAFMEGLAAARERMVAEQLVARGIVNAGVIKAMRTISRNSFLPSEVLADAYVDATVPIRYGRFMETPYVIASVGERLEPKPTDRVLEVGTGSGYEAAVLSELVQEVYSVEPLPVLAQRATVDLANCGFTNNLSVRQGEMSRGWPEAAPFDKIVFNGSLEQISAALVDQLKESGRLVIPVGDDNNLHVLLKTGGRLVPFAQWPVRPTPVPGNQVDVSYLQTVPQIKLK